MIHRVMRCQANEIVSMSQMDRCWLHTMDPFCTVVFVEDGFRIDQTTSVIVIEFDATIPNELVTFHTVFENGHVASTDLRPTDDYVYASLAFFDSNHNTFNVNWTSTVPLDGDVESNRIAYRYGSFGLMHYEAHLFYDLTTEVSDTLLSNEFTILLSTSLENIQQISVSAFSDEPILFEPFDNGENMFKLVAMPSGNESWSFDEFINDVYVRTSTHQRRNKAITVRCKRDDYDQHAIVKNVMVFPGRITDHTSLDRIGEQNICIGFKSGYHTDHGSDNIFLGKDSGSENVQGDSNIALGLRAYKNAQRGTDNVCIGTDSGSMNDTGHCNIFIGAESGKENQSGSSNIFIGERSGRSNQGGNNIIIGNTHQSGDNNIVIGNHDALSTGSDKLQIGNLIVGDMARNETVLYGSLRVTGSLLFTQSNVRLRIVTKHTAPELRAMFELVILKTAIESIDIIQLINEDESFSVDFKLIQNDIPVVRWKLAPSLQNDEQHAYAPVLSMSSTRQTLALIVTDTLVAFE